VPKDKQTHLSQISDRSPTLETQWRAGFEISQQKSVFASKFDHIRKQGHWHKDWLVYSA
jgi:hypothetical protein